MKKFLLIFFLPLYLFSSYSFEEPWGKDSDLCQKKSDPSSQKELSILTKIAHSVIVFKQKVISPVDGGRCPFRPCCSRYMQLAMERYGFFKGFVMGCDRLLRDNDEKWIYRTVSINGIDYKYDPAVVDKYSK
jgi:uncharacterized protein